MDLRIDSRALNRKRAMHPRWDSHRESSKRWRGWCADFHPRPLPLEWGSRTLRYGNTSVICLRISICGAVRNSSSCWRIEGSNSASRQSSIPHMIEACRLLGGNEPTDFSERFIRRGRLPQKHERPGEIAKCMRRHPYSGDERDGQRASRGEMLPDPARYQRRCPTRLCEAVPHSAFCRLSLRPRRCS